MHRPMRIVAMLGLLAVTLAACSETYPSLSSLAPQKKKFTATLTGASEVPAVTTSAAGTMELIQEDSVNIVYTIETTATTDSVTMAHIHAGAAGATGPIMVWFFPTEASRAAGTGGGTAASVKGILRVGRITRAGTTMVAPFTWDSLLVRMNAGTAYANIHTRKNAGGEIRGQVTPVP
ncbi:MAG: CHRD domain-containing protein [Gemmatimonadaceae bacterium]|nr:CHRD domain-containing protein [Gemmatimonadaceae bacterium]